MNLTQVEAEDRAALLAVTSYDVQLDLSGDDGFDSVSEVRFGCRRVGAASFIELDGQVRSVELNGRDVSPRITGSRIELTGLIGENVVRVVARCSYTNTGEGLHRFVDPADGCTYVYAQSFLNDAQRVFACFDQPDLKATFRLSVTSRPDWTVIANAAGSCEGDRWTFTPTERMSTYLFTLAAGPWAGEQSRHDGIALGVWCRRSLEEHLDADELFAITRQCLDFQQPLFGRRYPFGDTYDQVFVPEFNAGAMENPGMVTFTEDLLFRSRVTQGARRTRAMVIAHEMSHMWFGDLVTMRWWNDLWLNESFAELMGFLTVDSATSYDGIWTDFVTSRKAWGYRADALPTTHPVAGTAADTGSALQDFDGISYAKGASVLRQLMATIGQETFFIGVRAYLQRHAFANTTFTDLLVELEVASGRDLQAWATAWLRTSGTSTLRPVWVSPVRAGAGVGAAAGVIVKESTVLREHRLGVGAYDVRGDRLLRRSYVELTVAGTHTELPDVGARPDLLLVNDGDLTFAKIRFDERSLLTAASALGGLADPLARALCWAALWDATCDAELTAGAFVAALVGAAHAETDPAVLATLLSQGTLAANAYSRPGQARVRSELLAAAAWHRAGQAEPGSDLQLTWTIGLLGCTGDVARLQSILDGTDQLPGLVLDIELRWKVLRRLAVLGAVTVEDIEAVLAQDPTAAGERHADWARAARPDPVAKAAAWRSATGDASLSNSRAKALSGGFWQFGQDGVDGMVGDAADRYFAVVAELWLSRSPKIAESLARGLYPSTTVRAEILDQTDAVLADDLPEGLRRVLREERDQLRRALAAQAADDTGASTGAPGSVLPSS